MALPSRSVTNWCLLICTYFVLKVGNCGDSPERKLHMEINPGCNSKCKLGIDNYINLVHVSAIGDDDEVHYLWTTNGAPTFLVAYTPRFTTVSVDYKKFINASIPSGSIKFNDTILSSFTIILTKLWDYNDKNNTANIGSLHDNNRPVTCTGNAVPHRNYSCYDLSKLKWQNVSRDDYLGDFNVNFNTSASSFRAGNLFMNLRAFGKVGRDTILPHMSHHDNTTEFDLVLNNLTQNYKNTRFGLEMAFLSSVKPADSSEQITLRTSKSIDDEHTPGVFELNEVRSPARNDTIGGGFVQWKPVCYTARDHSVEDSLRTRQYDLLHGNKVKVAALLGKSRLARAVFGSGGGGLLAGATNVTFGQQDDGFYKATNYTFWTATFGYGAPPAESISATVITIIVVGVGVPGLLILVASAYVGVKRCRGSSTADERKPLLVNS